MKCRTAIAPELEPMLSIPLLPSLTRAFGPIGPHYAGPKPHAFVLAALLSALAALPAQAQLRIVTYNTTGAPRTGMDIILKSIGEESRNGIAKPIDVLILQEQNKPSSPGANAPSTNTQAFVTLLNSIYNNAGITYSMSNRTGSSSFSDDTTQTLIYRNQTVQLIADTAFGSASQPRQTLRYQLRPVGYTTPAANIYIYNSHYKASLDSPAPGTNANRRLDEATAVRANSDSLGQGTNVIYAGDHNFYFSDSREPAVAKLMSAGNGQAVDPLNRVGNWHENAAYADVHTQSPCATNCSLVSGGMDDRFDFQWVTDELMDGEGLSYIGPTTTNHTAATHSYHAFGNNGSTFNNNINSANNTVTFPGVTSYTKNQILNALWGATDHLPVVADYQVPAVMQAIASALPSSIDLGSTANISVTVSNIANVVAAVGADELDYSVTSSGSVSGSFLNQVDAALGSGNIHQLALNTSTIGAQSGAVSVLSTSQGVQNGTINIPVNFLVVLPGDYNGNGVVDAADYVVWRRNSGLTGGATYTNGDGNRDGNITIADYDIWRSNFGRTAAGFGAALASAVPEPANWMLAAMSICLAGRRPTRLKRWNRQS